MEGSLVAYKVFTNGSVLQASEVNDNLMNQSVIVFSSSAARASAITSPIEGMVTYLEDVNNFQFWNGSAWASLVSSGNIIINSNFEINQRGYVSAANLASGAYGFDRWKSTFTNTTLTYTSAPQGQEVTINSGGSIQQIVEQANLPAGTYTLSWTGTATGRVYNTGATPPSYAASPITVTLDGLANVEVEFTATGGTRTLSKVQLEAGSGATSYRRKATSVQAELAECQRYFYSVGGNTSYEFVGQGNQFSTTSHRMIINLPVQMRIAPSSLTVSSNAHFGVDNAANFTGTITSISLDAGVNSPSSAAIQVGTSGTIGAAGGVTRLIANNTLSAKIGVSAEL